MKTKNLQLRCPNCSTSFSPSDAIWNELKHSIENDLNSELNRQRQELSEERENVHRLTFQLNSEKQKLDELVNVKLKDRESFLRKQITEQLSAEKAEELQLLEESLAKKSKQLADQNKLKREMLMLQQETEERETAIVLKYEQKLQASLDAIKTESNQNHQLELGVKEKIISDLKDQLDMAKKKVDGYNGQLIGESAELQLELTLKTLFPIDNVVEVSKGVRGADVIQEIMLPGVLTPIDKIVYESKSVRNFSHGWIEKLKLDSGDARISVLVTKVMPKELEGQRFGIIDDVFICSHTSVRDLVILLRYSILKINQVILANKGKETKQQNLFDYITAPAFKSIFERVLNQLDSIRSSHEAEKKKLVKLWSEREKSLDIAINSTVELFGSLSAITDGGLDSIDSLELSLAS
jgi:hypothetical protein